MLRTWAHGIPLPRILRANVQYLDNKLDDIRVRIKFQRDIRDGELLFVVNNSWCTDVTNFC